jgi:hypothetical protein
MELIQAFQEMIDRGDQQEMYRTADVLKAAFYKVLKKEKIAIGFQVPAEDEVIISEASAEGEDTQVSVNPFARNFIYKGKTYSTDDFRKVIEADRVGMGIKA